MVAVQHRGPLVILENRSNQPVAAIVLQTRNGGHSPHGTHIMVADWHRFHWPNHGYQQATVRIRQTPVSIT